MLPRRFRYDGQIVIDLDSSDSELTSVSSDVDIRSGTYTTLSYYSMFCTVFLHNSFRWHTSAMLTEQQKHELDFGSDFATAFRIGLKVCLDCG